jgi:fatty-acyl-CoA synthase
MKGIASQTDVIAIEVQDLPTDLPASTYEMICHGAAINPCAPALSFFLRAADHHKPEQWTYREFVRDINRTANMFSRLGAGSDTVIAYLLPNLPETHFVIWGGEATGIVCAINPLLEGPAIAEVLNASGAEILAPFPGTDLWPKVHGIIENVPALKHLVLVNLADRVRGIKQWAARVLQRRECRRLHGRSRLPDIMFSRIEVHDFGKAMARESGAGLNSRRQFSPQALSSFFCTGGTTGLPKIAKRLHINEMANAWSVGQFFGDGIGPGKTIFCGLPLFHVNAVMATGLVPFSKGAHVVLGTPQGYRGEEVVRRFWEIVAHHSIHFFSGVPTLYAALLDVPVGDHDIRSLEYALCGAAPIPIEVFRRFEERTGVKILEGYGLTEGTCVSSLNPPLGERRTGSIGIRMPGQAMKAVVADDDGRYVCDCVNGQPGLLVISGSNVCAGYLQPEHNKGLWLELRDGRRWLNTGDMGYRDADGYFWLTGRKKDLIIRGGHNIDPATIEEAMSRHPAVLIAAAVGRPDIHAGELPAVYVQLKPGASAGEQELVEFARLQIAERAAIPKHVRILDTMPLTAVGKIFKPELRRIETIDAYRAALSDVGVKNMDLNVTYDATQRMQVQVKLADPSMESMVAKALGQFPLAHVIELSPGDIFQSLPCQP